MMDRRLQAVVDILTQRREWTTASTLVHACQQRGIDVDSRTIAELASDSDGTIIGTGAGYKLYSLASDGEILAAWSYNMKRALGSEIRARAIIANARRHGRLMDDQQLARQKQELEQEIGAPHAAALPTHHEHFQAQTLF